MNLENLFSLKGKTALVTGASRGPGQALQDDPVRNAEIEKRIPAGKWGSPEQLIGAAIFLASEASDYVNGHTLAVGGGWLAR